MTSPPEDPAPLPPEWPGDDACCGNGCDPCVFDVFYEAQDRYRADLRAWQARHNAAGNAPERPERPW